VNDIVGPSAPTCQDDPDFYIENALEWGFECGLPVEIRVGLTMSLTGNLSDDRMNWHVLQALKDWSSQISTKPVALSNGLISLGTMQTCARFCVMDDESNEEKMVQLYRDFSEDRTDGNGNSTRRASLLLGPSTESFRTAAAQVAYDYQMTMLLWSIPKELRSFPIAQQEHQNDELTKVIESIQLPSTQLVRDQIAAAGDIDTGVYGTLYAYPTYSCKDFPVPDGYYLRSGAEFLSCGGPCNVTHLDLCCRQKSSGLAVSGTWSPSSSLLQGGWHDGCLRGQSLVNVSTNMSLILHFERSPAHVVISLNWTTTQGSTAFPPYLIVHEKLYEMGSESDVLPENAVVYFSSPPEGEANWEICLRASCRELTCPGLFNRENFYCSGKSCTPEADTASCCTLEPPDLNGILWNAGFTPVFDLVAPVSDWAMDVIHQVQTYDSGRLLCVASQREHQGNFFGNLCHHYAKILGPNKADVMLATSALRGVSSLVRLKPHPTMVLVCSDLDFYMGFLHASILLVPDHGTVVSCLPFGSLLDTVRGFELNFRSLEPQPWPSYAVLNEVSINKPLADLASLRHTFQEVYQYHVQQNGSFPPALLFLYSAWQVIDYTAMTVAESVFQLSILSERGRGDSIHALASTTFPTYLGAIEFKGRGFRDLQRMDVATRQFVPMTFTQEMDSSNIAANWSWSLKMLRFLKSDVRVADIWEPILPVGNELHFNDMYPCPEGCIVWKTACSACPPGTYRSRSHTECQPCLPGTYQDSYAGLKCFPCPDGAVCNVTGGPSSTPGYFAVKAPDAAIWDAWHGPEACSIEGGGLTNLHPNDIGRWTASKKEPKWTMLPCDPPSACLGENICSPSQTGEGCRECQSGYSRLLRQNGICSACEDFFHLLRRCLSFVLAQVAMIFLLVWASHKDVDELGCLLCPIILTLLTAVQSFWLLSVVVDRTAVPDVIYDGMRYSIQVFMVPFLLHLLHCAPGGLPRSVETEGYAVLASAGFVYLLAFLLVCVGSLIKRCCCTRGTGARVGHFASFKSVLIAANHVVLPCALYWSILTVGHCTEKDCDHFDQLTESPQLLVIALVWLLFLMEVFMLWMYRYDFHQVSYRRDFGLLSTGVYRNYLLWPMWEFVHLMLLFAVISLLTVLDVQVTLIELAYLTLQVLGLAMLMVFGPFLSAVVPGYKQRIAVMLMMFPLLFSISMLPVFESYAIFAHCPLQQMVQWLLVAALLYVILYGLWVLYMNRVMVPLNIMKNTFYPFKCPKLVDLFTATAEHRVSVRKDLGLEFHAKRWSDRQRYELSWTIGYVMKGQFSASGMFETDKVSEIMEEAVREVCRSHKVATVKHINRGGHLAARTALAEGKDLVQLIQSHAGDIDIYELFAAVRDNNIALTVVQRHLMEKKKHRALEMLEMEEDSDPGQEADLQDEQQDPDSSWPSEPVQKKVHLERISWPEVPRSSRRLRRLKGKMLGDEVCNSWSSMSYAEREEEDLETRLWNVRISYQELARQLPMIARVTRKTREAFCDDDDDSNSKTVSLKEEVREVFELLNEVQSHLDSIHVDQIPPGRLRAWIGSIDHLIGVKAEVPLSTVEPELFELFRLAGLAEEAEAELAMTTAPSTVSRSVSEDSLERELHPKSPVRTRRFAGTTPSVAAGHAILKSKPRPVGRSTARLHLRS